MKIKNLKTSENKFSKFGKFVLICTTLGCMFLTGCKSSQDKNESNNIFAGTVLENARVITFYDGAKDVVVPIGSCRFSDYNHYVSIITGDYIGDSTCLDTKYNGNLNYRYKITYDESIGKYLIGDDLVKAFKGELTDEDIASIIVRVIDPSEEKGKALRLENTS